eukprot:6201658-Pleurochrysis_carterae.AAC.2
MAYQSRVEHEMAHRRVDHDRADTHMYTRILPVDAHVAPAHAAVTLLRPKVTANACMFFAVFAPQCELAKVAATDAGAAPSVDRLFVVPPPTEIPGFIPVHR